MNSFRTAVLGSYLISVPSSAYASSMRNVNLIQVNLVYVYCCVYPNN